MVLVIRTDHGQRIVVAMCGRAARAGVRVGLTLAHARALLPANEVHAADAEAGAEAGCLLALARWASQRWSPLVSVDPPDGLLIDTTGCDHLFGGEESLVRSVERAAAGLGFTPRVALASTAGTAWAVARFGGEPIVAAGREREALADLPTAGLRIDDETIAALAEVGIERIGQVLDLPRHALPGRYGSDLLIRLDQSLGHAFETLDRTSESPVISVSRELPGGTTSLEGIGIVIRTLLADVSTTLSRREAGVRRLDVSLDRIGGTPEVIVAQVSRATRDASHLWSLLRPKVERVNMGFGVERITLTARTVVRMAHQQTALSGEARARGEHDGEFAALVDTLASRLGRDSVLVPQRVASHRPERAFRLVTAGEPGLDSRSPDLPSSQTPRPPRLFETPSPASAVALHPDGPVLALRWRGEERRIRTTVGPERIGPEWWLDAEPSRDYFRVQDDRGRWLWVFREIATARWFVHGEWC